MVEFRAHQAWMEMRPQMNVLTLRRWLPIVATLGLIVPNASLAQSGSAAASSSATVTVQPGDSLWSIAQRYGTTVGALKAANHLTGDSLQPGTELGLPAGSDATPGTYVVQPGDSLYSIALAFHLSVEDLIAYNDLSGSVIRPGQTLVLHPSKSTPPTLRITVRPGDSLWALAQRYGTTVATLASANGIAANATLQPGEALTVPGQYATATADQGGAAPPSVTVTKGESLWSIAHAHGTTVAALMSANDLSSTELFPGESLTIVLPGQLGRAVPQATQPQPNDMKAMLWPIRGRITSYFGYRLLRVAGSNFHTGIDIAGHIGESMGRHLGEWAAR